MSKSEVYKLIFADETRPYSSEWRFKKNRSDVYVFARALGGVIKLSVHAPTVTKPQWWVQVKRRHNPASISGRFEEKLIGSPAYLPVGGLVCTATLIVPHSQIRRTDNSAISSDCHNETPPGLGMQALATVWVTNCDFSALEWPGSNKGTNLLWRTVLDNGWCLYLTRIDEPAGKISFQKAMLDWAYIRLIRENPGAAMLLVDQDSNGVVVMVDMRAARLLPNAPTVIAGRHSAYVRPVIFLAVWIAVLNTGTIMLSWRGLCLKLKRLLSKSNKERLRSP